MKFEDYNDYTELLARKDELKSQLIAISTSRQDDNRTIDTGWLQWTFGNGSNRQTILNNPDQMKEVIKIIENLIREELEEITRKMDEL